MLRIAKASRAGKQMDESERMFQDYLDTHGVSFDFEPKIEGKQKRPDFRVTWSGHVLLCEVKGLYGTQPRPRAANFDPYRSIRKEIHEVRRQFREYKTENCCVLILHNVSDWAFRDWPRVLVAAMLGDDGLEIPFDPERGILLRNQARHAHLGRGKMRDQKSGRVQNTGISAIAVLSERTISNPRFEAAYNERISELKARTGAEPTAAQRLEIRMALYSEIPVSLGVCPRISVVENPFARIPLPPEVFCGPWDERYRFDRTLPGIERVFAGDALKQAEREDHDDILQHIEEFCQEVVRHFAPQRIVLFGSHAYGRAEAGSDVDLLVVFPGDAPAADRAIEIQKRISRSFPLDLLTISAGELAHRLKLNDPFLREIVAHGKTLYEVARN